MVIDLPVVKPSSFNTRSSTHTSPAGGPCCTEVASPYNTSVTCNAPRNGYLSVTAFTLLNRKVSLTLAMVLNLSVFACTNRVSRMIAACCVVNNVEDSSARSAASTSFDWLMKNLSRRSPSKVMLNVTATAMATAIQNNRIAPSRHCLSINRV